MKPFEFNEQCKRLRDHYGDRQYTSTFLELLWKSLKDLPDGVFGRVVDECIEGQAVGHPPLKETFLELSRKYMSKHQTALRVVNNAECPHCDGLGYFFVENSNGNQSCASCETCERGRQLAHRSVHPIAPLSVARRHGYDIPRGAPRHGEHAG